MTGENGPFANWHKHWSWTSKVLDRISQCQLFATLLSVNRIVTLCPARWLSGEHVEVMT